MVREFCYFLAGQINVIYKYSNKESNSVSKVVESFRPYCRCTLQPRALLRSAFVLLFHLLDVAVILSIPSETLLARAIHLLLI